MITFAGCTLAGIPLLIHEGMSVGELRQLARAEAEAEEAGKHIAVTGANGADSRLRTKVRSTEGFRTVKCPFCSAMEDKVIDSREGRAGDLIRRRRECLKCGRRYTTYERIDEIPYMVIKKDGRRERFDRQKILQGLLKSCEKRPVATAKLEALVDEVERFVHEAPERQVSSVDALIESMSGGQRQAVALARATHQESKILLLDEPLAAMGAKESALVIDLVKDLSHNRGVSMLIIDHNYQHLFELCDRLNVLQEGHITLDLRVEDTTMEDVTALMVAEYRRRITLGEEELRV